MKVLLFIISMCVSFAIAGLITLDLPDTKRLSIVKNEQQYFAIKKVMFLARCRAYTTFLEQDMISVIESNDTSEYAGKFVMASQEYITTIDKEIKTWWHKAAKYMNNDSRRYMNQSFLIVYKYELVKIQKKSDSGASSSPEYARDLVNFLDRCAGKKDFT